MQNVHIIAQVMLAKNSPNQLSRCEAPLLMLMCVCVWRSCTVVVDLRIFLRTFCMDNAIYGCNFFRFIQYVTIEWPPFCDFFSIWYVLIYKRRLFEFETRISSKHKCHRHMTKLRRQASFAQSKVQNEQCGGNSLI